MKGHPFAGFGAKQRTAFQPRQSHTGLSHGAIRTMEKRASEEMRASHEEALREVQYRILNDGLRDMICPLFGPRIVLAQLLRGAPLAGRGESTRRSLGQRDR